MKHKELYKVINSFVWDPLSSMKKPETGFWYAVSDDKVTYNFNHKNKTINSYLNNHDCFVLGQDGLTSTATTSLTGKLTVPLVNSCDVDFTKAVDEFLCFVCIYSFKNSLMNFNQIKHNEIDNWISDRRKEDDCSSFYASDNMIGLLNSDVRKFLTSLPDNVIMSLPSAEVAGIIPIVMDKDDNLSKFGIFMFDDIAKFAIVIDNPEDK